MERKEVWEREVEGGRRKGIHIGREGEVDMKRGNDQFVTLTTSSLKSKPRTPATISATTTSDTRTMYCK